MIKPKKMDKDEDNNDPFNESDSNRTFLLFAGILGGLVFLGLLCIAGFLFFRNSSNQQSQVTAEFQVTQQQATVQAGVTQTLIAQNLTQTAAVTNTVPPTNTPVIAEATATSSPTPAPATVTVAAAFTQIANSTQTIIPTSTALPNSTPNSNPTPIETSTFIPTITPGSPSATSQPVSPMFTIEEQFALADAQIKESMSGSFSFIAPITMQLEEGFTVKLVLNLSQTPNEVASAIVATSGLPTSQTTPGQPVTEQGNPVQIVSSRIEITPRMQALLISKDPDAFTIQSLHHDPIQMVGTTSNTEWEWDITAKKEGNQELVVIIYQLVRIGNEEDWRTVETQREDINVQVSITQRLKALDWKWGAGYLLALIGAFVGVLNYLNNKKKSPEPRNARSVSRQRKK
jgi:hypothetical protein